MSRTMVPTSEGSHTFTRHSKTSPAKSTRLLQSRRTGHEFVAAAHLDGRAERKPGYDWSASVSMTCGRRRLAASCSRARSSLTTCVGFPREVQTRLAAHGSFRQQRLSQSGDSSGSDFSPRGAGKRLRGPQAPA